VLLLAALLARLWFLQVLAGDRFAELADSNRLRTVVSQAPRGHILASDGRELVVNRPALALTADRQLAGQRAGQPRDAGAARSGAWLAELLEVEEETLLRRINDVRYSPFRPVPSRSTSLPRSVLVVRQNQELFPGISAETMPVRDYPEGELAAHLVGYLGQVSREELASRATPTTAAATSSVAVGSSSPTRRSCADVAARRSSSSTAAAASSTCRASVHRRAGLDLVTWLDLDAQRAAEDALREGIVASRSIRRTDGRLLPSTAGSAIVMDVRTGGIVAMASYPTYDPRSSSVG
jgi:penicillin-binding protein 2